MSYEPCDKVRATDGQVWWYCEIEDIIPDDDLEFVSRECYDARGDCIDCDMQEGV